MVNSLWISQLWQDSVMIKEWTCVAEGMSQAGLFASKPYISVFHLMPCKCLWEQWNINFTVRVFSSYCCMPAGLIKKKHWKETPPSRTAPYCFTSKHISNGSLLSQKPMNGTQMQASSDANNKILNWISRNSRQGTKVLEKNLKEIEPVGHCFCHCWLIVLGDSCENLGILP